MQVILIKTVADLGEAGNVKNVKPGYARNYLFPNGLAEVATPALIAKAEAARVKQAKNESTDEAELKKSLGKVVDFVLELSASANKDGKLYGSITAEQVLRELSLKLKLRPLKHASVEPAVFKQSGQIPAQIIVPRQSPTNFIINIKPTS